MSGTNAGIGTVGAAAATVDPNPCNALVEGPGGLLVPSTVLEGIAPGGAVAGGRSVDIDVTAPAGTDCPQEWQIGARLTPVFGEAFIPAAVSLVAAANDAWVDTGLSVNLPEAGVYEVTATVRSSIARGNVTAPFAVNISARLFNVTAGGAIPGTDYTVQQVNEASPSSGQTTWVALGTFHKFVTVAGPVTIRLEASRNTINGAAVNVTGIQTGNTRLAFKKIAD
ncbi:hypothetical protein [Streptomyces werraensis]|uniref:hypothetical protein n=1 Tax=Streptomyces werraensis TaxID=68284 RepID=UPI0037CDA613